MSARDGWPSAEEVTRRLRVVLSDDETSAWWQRPNGYLDGQTPTEAWPDVELAVQAELQQNAFIDRGGGS